MHIVVMVFTYEDKVVVVSILLLYSVLKCIKWGVGTTTPEVPFDNPAFLKCHARYVPNY